MGCFGVVHLFFWLMPIIIIQALQGYIFLQKTIAMWIRTQDKRELVKVIKFSISKSIGEKRCFVFGHFAGNAFFSDNSITLGEYPSFERAQEELDRIQEHIASNSQQAYSMSGKE